MILLIHPPVSKPCEPPAGIAKLCGAMVKQGVKHDVFDANIEGLLTLLEDPSSASDTWTRRAARHRFDHLASLKQSKTYRQIDRYKRAVLDLNRLLDQKAFSPRIQLGLANYQHQELSPVRSRDLIRAAETPEENPFYPFVAGRLTRLIERESPTMIGVSLNYLSQALCAFAILGLVKRDFPALTLVLGGGLLTSWMKKPGWKNPFKGLVDHVVCGPGEGPLLSILNASKFKEEEMERHDGTTNYDRMPFENYLSPGTIIPYSASSGCYWNRCAFCPERAEGNPYAPIPIKKVMADLDSLIKTHRPTLIHVLDNAISPALMKAFAKNPPGSPWYGFARITKDLANQDFCLALKHSGCVMLKLGLESGDQRVLDRMQKDIDLEVASTALKALKKAGISTYVYLLFGTPPEGLPEARKTLRFVLAHHEQIDFLNVAIFNLPIYGPETAELDTKMFYGGDLSLYTDFTHPRGWHRKLVRQFLDKEFRRDPAIASILKRDPPVFTSNHAPFFRMP